MQWTAMVISGRARAALLVALFLTTAKAASLQLHPKNPHYFLFAGKAAVLIASGEHYGAVMNADFDYRRYLATLQADGMNYTRLFGGSYLEVPAKSFGILRNDLAPGAGRYVAPWNRSGTPGYRGGGNKFELSQWNPVYFERLRDFLAEADKRGIVVEITFFSSHYDEAQWRISALNPENNVKGTSSIDWKKLHTLENGNILAYQERYVRKLVREANRFDGIIFEIQNEPWSDRPLRAGVVNPYLPRRVREKYPNSIEVADDLSTGWQAKVAEWISNEEASLPKKHLIAQNYCNFFFLVRTLVPRVSIVNFHYAYPDAVLLNYGLGKALSYDETGFLGRDDDVYRRQAWNFMLSGGSAFDNLDYSFSAGHEDGKDTEPNGPGGGSPALRHQLRILKEFLESFSLVELKPDMHTVTHAAGVYTRTLSIPGREYGMYFDGDGPLDVTLDLPARKYAGAWVDTKTGRRERLESFSHAGGKKILRTPEFRNGIALDLKRQ
jgi:hypothetical protein